MDEGFFLRVKSETSDGSGSKILGTGWVGSAFMVWVWEILHKNVKFL